MKDLYKILGVRKDATKEQIRNAYYRLAKKMHPDVNGSTEEANNAFKEVAFAYSILADAGTRERYDNGEDITKVDNSAAKLMQHLAELVVKAIQNHDVKFTDICEVMRNELTAAITGAEAMRGKADEAIATCNEALSRFQGEKEVIEAILGSTIVGMNRQKEKMQEEIDILKEMQARIKKLTYKVDKRSKKESDAELSRIILGRYSL